jgi:hypothetical protein
MQILLTLLLSLFGALSIFTVFVFVVNYIYASKGYTGRKSDHFDGKRFYNIGWSAKENMRIERFEGQKGGLLYWMLHRTKTKWKKRKITPVVPPASNTK